MADLKANILIIDDKQENLSALEKLLRHDAFNIISANSGNQALRQTLKYDFALIILDIQMPEMNGYEVAKLLKEHEETQFVPIIFVTAAYSDELHRVMGYETGAVDYIEKPIQDKILLAKVRIFVQLWEQQQELAQAISLLELQKAELEQQVILRQQANDKAEYLATHDPLTGLANRTLLHAQIETAVANTKRNNKKLALLFIDLDNFKPINDQHSHAAGDYVLKTTAERILHCVRDMDTVARYGGDEFIILLPDLQHPEAAIETANRINHKIAEPMSWQENTLNITSSIGVAIYPDTVNTIDMLMMGADSAMYEAKDSGKNGVVVYSV